MGDKSIDSSSRENGMHFFLAMLPELGSVGRLAAYGPAFFARLESVRARREDAHLKEDSQTQTMASAEETMLAQALEWIESVREE